MAIGARLLSLLAPLMLLGSCSSGSAPAQACGGSVEVVNGPRTESDPSFKELIIVDDAVLTDSRTLNALDGPWSFRYAIENMAPVGTDPAEFVRNWFTEWITGTSFNGYPIPDGQQVAAGATLKQFATGMDDFILCPWAKATAANGCNSDCSSCTTNPPKLDLAKAPFRLIAIANRMDLRVSAGINPLGEGRLVFALTRGPADDATSATMSMTLNLEYVLPPTLTLNQWAQVWHQLASYPSFDSNYLAALQVTTDRFVSRDGMPQAPNGSALSQARTNGDVIFWAWQMRQFQIGTDGQMHPHTVRNTPDPSFNGTPALQQFIEANAEGIKNDNYLVPDSMLSATADEFLFTWSFPGLDPSLEQAFIRGTCDGCHSSGLNPSVDQAFQVSPLRSGLAKLGPFVNNPNDPGHDDLAKRGALLAAALCSP